MIYDMIYQISQRVANQWNALPYNVATASSVNAFKSCLDKFYDSDSEYTSKYKYLFK